MPLVRTSQRQRVRRSHSASAATPHRHAARRSKKRFTNWAEVLESPASLHRNQVALFGAILIAGWGSLLLATVASFG